MSKIPWVECYRPTTFDNIVLEDYNKEILLNILNTKEFPNLLLYGPPGTGKTTTILNLINSYQNLTNTYNKDLVIHLNASDERGIDVIRNQISSFVNSKPLFNKGMKIVILDEVDYMTKSAQQAFKYLLQTYADNTRFCLICNYISKIDEGVQNEFIKLRFNQLPPDKIINFLKYVSTQEELNISDETLCSIQLKFKSDIRSMINYLQVNQNIIKINKDNINVMTHDTYELLISFIKNNNCNDLNNYIYNLSITFNIDKKNIIKDLINYIIRNKNYVKTSHFLYFVENLIHSDQNNSIYLNYAFVNLKSFFKSECLSILACSLETNKFGGDLACGSKN
jgi:replication factor C subunit 3/5